MSSSKPESRYRTITILSTDTKPTLKENEAGSRLVESDTYNEYEWSSTEWFLTAKKGAQRTYVSDVNTLVVNEFFNREVGASTTLAVAAASGDTDIDVVSAAGFTIGDTVTVENGLEEATFPTITNIVVNNITLDQPLDNDYAIGDLVKELDIDLSSTAGTLAAPISYKLAPERGEKWHIYRLLIVMTHPAAAADNLFGDLAALTNGVVVRGYDSATNSFRTFTNWKSNADIKLDMYDVSYTDKAGPTLFGTNGRGSLRIGTGAVPELDTGDYLEVLIQDDITLLASFSIKAQGHVV